MNWIALAELGLAVMVTQTDLFNRLLDTTPLKVGQFGLALGAAVPAPGAVGDRQADRATTGSGRVAKRHRRASGVTG